MTSVSAKNAAHIRILIVDDHPAVRQGLTLLLEPKNITVCAEAASRLEALSLVKEHRPDVVLVDLSLGEEDGKHLLEDLRDCDQPALVYSMHEEGRRVAGAFAAGAMGYVTKREAPSVLVQAIAEVAARNQFVSPRAALALANYAAAGSTATALNQLSDQEQEVYRLLEEGRATRHIAVIMSISVRTVESYCERICAKLGLSGMRELRHFASRHLDGNAD